ncbi:MAG: tetratricopeptide repeat protein [Lachnospiraceae bacterium]|nr:tetratricopeptide repeat protein [Lachnospiraceae bacterium]
MFCYNCGCHLSEHDFCTACGVDVSLYKKIIHVSNMYYNEGLEKATVRDLSGAITSLRQSLKFNKNHIEARNLLGLVYFETGEVVAALSEWVISKNLRPEKNIADTYIEMVQSNAGRLDAINQTIKKYNQALLYCMNDSKDLAIIQLKKVLSLNAKFVRAHQLLALLYIDSEQWEKARRELVKCMDIDRNNTQTLRYMKEVERMLAPDENDGSAGKKKKDDIIRYQSGNEVVIQPASVKEPKSNIFTTLINVVVGLIIGLAAMYFLVVPAAVMDAQNDAQKAVTEIANQMDAKTQRVQELEKEVAKLTDQNKELSDKLAGYVGTDGTLKNVDFLLNAAKVYLETQDVKQTEQQLGQIEQTVVLEDSSESFRSLYTLLLQTIGPELCKQYYNEGYTAFRNEEYETAIELFTKAVKYDATHVEALFNLGNAYRLNGDKLEAISTYEQVISLFPDTERARRALRYKQNLEDDLAG